MTNTALRIRSVDCPRTQSSENLVFDVHLNSTVKAATDVQCSLSGSGYKAPAQGGSCEVSFDEGRSYQPWSGEHVSVPAGVCSFKVRVCSPPTTV